MKRYYFVLLFMTCCLIALPGQGEQWYKGGLHMHSLWSDGDAAPEVYTAWYRDHGWHFICYTDHNILLEGDNYRPISEDTELNDARVAALREQFGDDWVVVEERIGRMRMRLKTFEELAAHFNEPGSYLLIHGEEITSFGGNPHVNAVNVVERTGGLQKDDVSLRIRQYLGATAEQSAKHGRPMLAIVNHPNWSDGVTIEEATAVEELRFFEVYNGHPSVNNWGHEGRGYPSTDRFWDVVLSMRLKDDPEYILYGVATDDAHNYHKWGPRQANPGRGWVMVRAAELSVEALIAAMDQGAFYSSTGVSLDNIRRDASGLAFDILAEPGVTYTTRFIGTRRGFSTESTPVSGDDGEPKARASHLYSDEIGEVFLETTDLTPAYRFSGDELYVRALVVSDKAQSNPVHETDMEMAWVQPQVNR